VERAKRVERRRIAAAPERERRGEDMSEANAEQSLRLRQ
jgi:hypothetical protein